ncbi:response regulator transcription factor [Devosia sp. ZB163]|uniref:response regulator transcription factor n=1 Tax=Devosia sp. ZB163 TaxID=3025938 RepID=UPI00235F485D|nr:response regulator transcription factor [Devosia sp. ZB163]MDC9823350.1 response regulator transcription factor [Devosia sp. ZB163]
MRILLVEDEPELASMLRTTLEKQGYVVDHAATLEVAEEAIAMIEHDVALLDRQLSDGDGIALLDLIRKKRPNLPVIVISALGKPADRVHGLDKGADDYLAKPFLIEELIARMRAVLRRPANVQTEAIMAGNVEFDITRGVIQVDGNVLELPRREFLALEALMRRPGQTVRRTTLEQSVYGVDDEIQSNSLDANISRLRRKLSDAGASVEIHPVRGVGYLLRTAK